MSKQGNITLCSLFPHFFSNQTIFCIHNLKMKLMQVWRIGGEEVQDVTLSTGGNNHELYVQSRRHARRPYIILVKWIEERLNCLHSACVVDMVVATVKKGKPDLRKEVLLAMIVCDCQCKPWRRMTMSTRTSKVPTKEINHAAQELAFSFVHLFVDPLLLHLLYLNI